MLLCYKTELFVEIHRYQPEHKDDGIRGKTVRNPIYFFILYSPNHVLVFCNARIAT